MEPWLTLLGPKRQFSNGFSLRNGFYFQFYLFFNLNQSLSIRTSWQQVGIASDNDLALSEWQVITYFNHMCISSLRWCYNGRDSVSNHQPRDCSTVYSDANQRKHQSFASLAFVRRIHRGPVNSPHEWPVTWKMFPFDDVIMMGLLL